MPGAPDPLYIQARRVLLDATDALAEQLDAIVLVGAQAIYLHTGDTNLAVAEFTTDADFSIGPADLGDSPLLADLMKSGGFTAGEHPGAWLSPDGIAVDLMVPEALAGAGSRGARLGPHGKRVARRAKGLEGALVDRDRVEISALDPSDERAVFMWVAGPGALLVAKSHKISERVDDIDRARDKDALDVFRLLGATETRDVVRRIGQLRASEVSAAVTQEAVEQLDALFGSVDAVGVQMVVRAAGPNADPDLTAASMIALVADLLSEL